jgi:DNA-binding HxlR family transcriptional regulator
LQLEKRISGDGAADAIENAAEGALMEKVAKELRECGLPSALEVMGDRWSFMILRAAFNGICNFEDFLGALGIARNILSNRLLRLVDCGIMQRLQMTDDRRKFAYCLTEKGEDLLPAVLALREWGAKHSLGVESNPVLADRRDRQPIAPMRIHAADGREITWHELMWLDRSEIDTEAAVKADQQP